MSQAVAGSSPSLIPFFDGEDYEYWKIKMRTFLKAEGLWTLVEKGFNEPENEAGMSDARKTRCCTTFGCKRSQQNSHKRWKIHILENIKCTTNEAWDTSEQEFHGDEKVRTINLQTL
ncbi:hypothetical protein Sango_2113700 [Sesamum angolense]|uniref:DUF4219 domain-containing protein n=1 Tax=Sesamum angolense TaxID=2727404 RepID=A0AAE1WBW9_9LAMI|nr:hypothetical protein Sango_2113700 [Sesamum angolense]